MRVTHSLSVSRTIWHAAIVVASCLQDDVLPCSYHFQLTSLPGLPAATPVFPHLWTNLFSVAGGGAGPSCVIESTRRARLFLCPSMVGACGRRAWQLMLSLIDLIALYGECLLEDRPGQDSRKRKSNRATLPL